ncbi:MAG: hypothetical protein ACOC4E_00365 [Patescibacteria group bacterium]
MSNTTINIAIALGLATLAFGAYYLYTQQGGEELFFTNDERMMQDMLSQTRVFIERRQLLEGVELNVELFDDPRFRNLEDYSTPLVEPPQGRENPFAPYETVSPTN